MQIRDAMKLLKFLRAAVVPVISIALGVPAVVCAQAQGTPSAAPTAAAAVQLQTLHRGTTKAPQPVCPQDGKS